MRSPLRVEPALSQSPHDQCELLSNREQRRRFGGIVKPFGQLAVGEQIQPQHRCQIGQRPVRFGEVMQPFQQEQRDQGCPNLDAKRVFAGAHETLHSQVLFQRLEEQLDLPTLLVDGGDRGRAEVEQVSEQDNLSLVIRIPNDYAAQRSGAIGLRLNARELNDLVGADVAIRRDVEFSLGREDGIVLHAGDEEDAGQCPPAEERVVSVAAIHGHDGTGVQGEGVGQFDVAALGLGEQHVNREVVVMIEQDVRFDAALGAAELRPGKQGEAQ